MKMNRKAVPPAPVPERIQARWSHLMDALHPQVQTGHAIVQERGGNFVMFVKGNQNGFLEQAKHFLPEDFSSGAAAGRGRSWSH